MKKRILTMTVAAMTVIAAMTGCNKKDAGSVDTTKQNTVTDAETTAAAETTTEVETTTEAETTTEYSYENDPYFDMENLNINLESGEPYLPYNCIIDGDTYMAITGAECIAENVPNTIPWVSIGTQLCYYGLYESPNKGDTSRINISTVRSSRIHDVPNIKKIYTVPQNPYIEREAKGVPVTWIGENLNHTNSSTVGNSLVSYPSIRCVRFLCEFDIDGTSCWEVYDKLELEEYGVNIEDYIDFMEYARSIVGITPETETTTEYDYENAPYFDMENAIEPKNGDSKYCLIDGDTYMAITGAECIAENVPVIISFADGGSTELRYRGRNKTIGLIRMSERDNTFHPTEVKKIYTVPLNPYVETEYESQLATWMRIHSYSDGIYCADFLCEFDNNGESRWEVCDKNELKSYYGINIEDYIDFEAYAKTIVGK